MIDNVLVDEKDKKLARNVKVILGPLQHGLLRINVISREMGKKVEKKVAVRGEDEVKREKESFERKS